MVRWRLRCQNGKVAFRAVRLEAHRVLASVSLGKKFAKSGNPRQLYSLKNSANLLADRKKRTQVAKVASRDFRIGTEVAFSGVMRKQYPFSCCAFFRPQKERRNRVKDIPIIPHGIVSIENLSEAERRSFYAAMLVRILAHHRAEQENTHQATNTENYLSPGRA